jgi:RND superfamily putative drug exporter
VLLDAFVVRLVIVPAAMTLLGRSSWWLPSWLDRVLPHVGGEPPAAPPAVPVADDADDAEPALVPG